MEPDEWTEPVIVFDKPKLQAKTAAKAKPKPKFKLAIGVADDEKMLPNPHSNFPPPQKPIP